MKYTNFTTISLDRIALCKRKIQTEQYGRVIVPLALLLLSYLVANAFPLSVIASNILFVLLGTGLVAAAFYVAAFAVKRYKGVIQDFRKIDNTLFEIRTISGSAVQLRKNEFTYSVGTFGINRFDVYSMYILSVRGEKYFLIPEWFDPPIDDLDQFVRFD